MIWRALLGVLWVALSPEMRRQARRNLVRWTDPLAPSEIEKRMRERR